MTALSLILAIIGGFVAFGEFEPIYNALGVLLLVICVRLFCRLVFRRKKGDL